MSPVKSAKYSEIEKGDMLYCCKGKDLLFLVLDIVPSWETPGRLLMTVFDVKTNKKHSEELSPNGVFDDRWELIKGS